MRIDRILAFSFAMGALLGSVLCGCGGSGSSSPRTTPVKVDIHWAARSRALNGPSSALSATMVLKQAAAVGGDLTFTVNRNIDPAAYTGSYISSTTAKVGTWDMTAQ